MINFLLYCFATIGLTNIIIDSSIFEPFRNFFKLILHEKVYEFFECHQCCGTWCGFLCGYALISHNLAVAIMAGFAGSFLASFYYLLRELMISKTDFDLNIDE